MQVYHHVDVVVIGGGLAGTCAAIAAARNGMRVALIQDRPVLGGNASSEVRLWALGATSHMGNNNRWAREGGIINEILVENTFRNKEGNPVLFDMILIDKVLNEKNITLHVNTVVYDIVKKGQRVVEAVKAYNPQNETAYTISGSMFCDASGDGILAYQAGATYRSGAEDREEFDEKFAPDKEDYGELLGHSLFFYTKQTPAPVKFVPPGFAMPRETVEKEIYRLRDPNYFKPMAIGCNYWWLEYGGRLDTIHDTEQIKYKLWSVAYGIWDYIKNSGKFPESENMTLEWVGIIPGKRESRRFIGPYMLNQKDIIEQRTHYDAVSFGGWSIDLHPSDGVFSKKKGCNQWHSKGVYQIPYRCYITKDLENVFIAGRLISVSHVAFGSTRVMLTTALGGEVVGTAAALCVKKDWKPSDIAETGNITALQDKLLCAGNYIPFVEPSFNFNLLSDAVITPSSELVLMEIPFEDGLWKNLSQSAAQMLPIPAGSCPSLSVAVIASETTEMEVQLRISSKSHNHTPDITLATQKMLVKKGKQEISIQFDTEIPHDCYVFVCFMKNDKLDLLLSQYRITGILSVFNKILPSVSNWGKQVVTEDIGVEEFEFWSPERRPGGHNIAMKISPSIEAFGISNILSHVNRPVDRPNAWVAALDDKNPHIIAKWDKIVCVKEITLLLDTDWDHPMETVQWGHADSRMPFCVDSIAVFDGDNRLIAEKKENYQTRVCFRFDLAVQTGQLTFVLTNSSERIPVSVFGIEIQ